MKESESSPAEVRLAAAVAVTGGHRKVDNDAQELRALVAAGVDGVFTNRPDVLNAVLEEQGLARGGSKPLRDASAAADRSRACRT